MKIRNVSINDTKMEIEIMEDSSADVKQETQEDAINGDLSESDEKDSVGHRDESTDEGIAASVSVFPSPI